MHTSIPAFSRIYLGYQSVMHQGTVRDCDYQWRKHEYHQRGLLAFLRSTPIISRGDPSICGGTLSWLSPCWSVLQARMKWKNLHFCPFLGGFFWVSLGEWVLPVFLAGLQQFLVAMSTGGPCWLHHWLVGASFLAKGTLRLLDTAARADINWCVLGHRKSCCPKTVKTACCGLHPASLRGFPF